MLTCAGLTLTQATGYRCSTSAHGAIHQLRISAEVIDAGWVLSTAILRRRRSSSAGAGSLDPGTRNLRRVRPGERDVLLVPESDDRGLALSALARGFAFRSTGLSAKGAPKIQLGLRADDRGPVRSGWLSAKCAPKTRLGLRFRCTLVPLITRPESRG